MRQVHFLNDIARGWTYIESLAPRLLRRILPEREQAMIEDRTGTLEALAASLANSWRTGTRIDLPEEGLQPASRAEAYLVQDRMASLIGEPVTGWKAGATSEGMRARDGHDDIVPGRTFASRTFSGNCLAIPADRFAGARMEPEFAFKLRHRIEPRPAPWTPDEIAQHVTMHVAVELIGSRYRVSASAGTLATIADNGNGAGLVVGPAVTRTGTDFRSCPVFLRVDRGPAAANSPPDIRCEPFSALADVANHLSKRGIALDEGAYVTTGSATETLPVVPGSTAIADFADLGKIEINFE